MVAYYACGAFIVNINGFSPNFVCALILWRSGLGLPVGKFVNFDRVICLKNMSVFPFLDNNFSKFQWIFTKFGICIDIVEIWFGIANGQIT